MIRNIRILFIVMCAIGVLSVGPVVHALTADDVQVQIKELLAKIADLTKQIQELRNTPVSSIPTVSNDAALPTYRICAAPSRNLSQGAEGDDVQSLQEFLRGEGFLSANATGFFGPITAQAVAKWQTSQGVTSIGSVGPMTRERIKIWCGGTTRLSVAPQSGSAPLTVTFVSTVGDGRGRPSYVDGQDTMLDFGDGSEPEWVSCGAEAPISMGQHCSSPVKIQHTYSQNGDYVATLKKTGGRCFGACGETVLGSVKIHVGEAIACTMEYAPVCGAKQVLCIKAPCNPVSTTYGNRCVMNADKATFLYRGECKDATIDPSSDSQCKSWHDGCNSCGRSTPGGPAMCTLKYCTPESMSKPYCNAYFDSTPSNKPPVISGFSGPTTLELNAIGTWTINASDPENGQLNYQVWWGDENMYAPTMNALTSSAAREFVQATTFTHAYASAGTYTVTILVRDATGQEAKTSVTVSVGKEQIACIQVYQPVCGRPVGCANTCAPGMMCPAICQLYPAKTYSNTCYLNDASAEFLYNGQCTSTGSIY